MEKFPGTFAPSSWFQTRQLLHRMSRATKRTGNRPRVGLSAQLIQINAHEMCDQRGSYDRINCHIATSSLSRFGYFFVLLLNPTSKTFTCQFHAIWSFEPGPRLYFQMAAGLDKSNGQFSIGERAHQIWTKTQKQDLSFCGGAGLWWSLTNRVKCHD